MREPELLAHRLDARPADPWHAAVLQPARAAGQEPEAVDAAVLLRVLERELQAEADAERRAAGATRSRSASSSEAERSAPIALAAEPTPGRTARPAAATTFGSVVTVASAPSRPNAIATERTFPAP